MKSLTCREVRELLAAEEMKLCVAPDATHACERHLAACEDCRRALLEGKELSELLESSLAAYADGADDLAERITANLPAPQPEVAYWRSRVFRLDAAAAALLFGAGLFVGWWFQSASPSTPAPVAGEASIAPAAITPHVVGSQGTVAHELLPRDRVRTSENRHFIIVNPANPNVIIEVDRQAIFEDDLKLPRTAGHAGEVPVE